MADSEHEIAQDVAAVERTLGLVRHFMQRRVLATIFVITGLSSGGAFLSAKEGNRSAAAAAHAELVEHDVKMTALVHGYVSKTDSTFAAHQTELDSLKAQGDERWLITRAVGVKMCQEESRSFINLTNLPCEKLLHDLSNRSPTNGGSGGLR